MEQLFKDTEQRIQDLEKTLEGGQQIVQELNYRRDLQVIENDRNSDEIQRLRELLDNYQPKQLEKSGF